MPVRRGEDLENENEPLLRRKELRYITIRNADEVLKKLKDASKKKQVKAPFKSTPIKQMALQ